MKKIGSCVRGLIVGAIGIALAFGGVPTQALAEMAGGVFEESDINFTEEGEAGSAENVLETEAPADWESSEQSEDVDFDEQPTEEWGEGQEAESVQEPGLDMGEDNDESLFFEDEVEALESADAEESGGREVEALATSGTIGGCKWSIDSAGTLTIEPKNGSTGTLTKSGGSDWPWTEFENCELVKTVVFKRGVKAKGSLEGLLSGAYDLNKVTSVDLGGLDTTEVTSMKNMFRGLDKLKYLDVSGLDTKNVTDMSDMFGGCFSLRKLDLSNFNTAKVTNMQGMFINCLALSALNVSSFNTSHVTNMSEMFAECHSLSSLSVSGFNTARVTTFGGTFAACKSLRTLDLHSWNTARAKSMMNMFLGCSSLVRLDLSGFNTSSLIVDPGWPASPIDSMFRGCTSLKELDISGFDTSRLSSGGWMGNICDGCTSLEKIKVGKGYHMNALEAFPVATSSSGKWWSLSKKAWYTPKQVVSSRSGVADTYYRCGQISKAAVTVSNCAYTGRAVKPSPTVKLGSITLTKGKDYTLSYKNNVNVGTATVTVTGKGLYRGTKSVKFKIFESFVTYRTHVQKDGWQDWRHEGQTSGTSGRGLRLEGINIKLENASVSGGVTYRTHVQKIGWQGWRSNGAMSGTSGKALRLEAIQIKLTGDMAKKYDVYYRVHAQHFGWMGWAKNGASSGTAGYAYRLEAIQIRVVPKGSAAPGATSNAFRQK